MVYAASSSYQCEVNVGSSLTGQLALGTPHEVTDFPVYFSCDRDIDLGRLWGMKQALALGGLAQYSSISYETGKVKRSGYHRLFGIRSGWRLSSGPWSYMTSLDLFPVSLVSVFSTVETQVNGDAFKITSQSELFGYGVRLRQGMDREFKFRLFGSRQHVRVGMALGFLMESFNKRRDTVIRTNRTDPEVTASETVKAGTYGGSMVELTLSLGYRF